MLVLLMVQEATQADTQVAAQPVYIALVDMTCSTEFLELVKSGLLAALEGLVPSALFGLIAFSSKVTHATK